MHNYTTDLDGPETGNQKTSSYFGISYSSIGCSAICYSEIGYSSSTYKIYFAEFSLTNWLISTILS